MGSRHSLSTCFELSRSSSSGDHSPCTVSFLVYSICCSPPVLFCRTRRSNKQFLCSPCGANTIEDALRLQQEPIAPLGRGRFHLRKFCASHPSILEAVPPDCTEMDVPIELDSKEGIRTLGLLWHPLSDQFPIIKGTCSQRLRAPKKKLSC